MESSSEVLGLVGDTSSSFLDFASLLCPWVAVVVVHRSCGRRVDGDTCRLAVRE